MSAEIDECPSLRFQDIRKNKVSPTDTQTDGQRENSIPHQKVCGGGGIIIVTLFQEDNIFSTNASLTYGPQIQRHTCV